MATLIDSLLVTLSLDGSQFAKEQKRAVENIVKTKKETERQAKEIEAAGKRAAEARRSTCRTCAGACRPARTTWAGRRRTALRAR